MHWTLDFSDHPDGRPRSPSDPLGYQSNGHPTPGRPDATDAALRRRPPYDV